MTAKNETRPNIDLYWYRRRYQHLKDSRESSTLLFKFPFSSTRSIARGRILFKELKVGNDDAKRKPKPECFDLRATRSSVKLGTGVPS
jgi:hypothetical protein